MVPGKRMVPLLVEVSTAPASPEKMKVSRLSSTPLSCHPPFAIGPEMYFRNELRMPQSASALMTPIESPDWHVPSALPPPEPPAAAPPERPALVPPEAPPEVPPLVALPPPLVPPPELLPVEAPDPPPEFPPDVELPVLDVEFEAPEFVPEPPETRS